MLFLIQLRSRNLNVFRLLRVSKRQYIKKSEKGIPPTSKALQHFDDYYGSVFGKDWNSIRLALLCKPKKVALLNRFSVAENQTEDVFISSGAQNIQNISQNQELVKPSKRGIEAHHSTATNELNFETSSENRFSLESYVPVSKMRVQEEIISESEYYSFYSSENESVQFIKEDELILPKQWKVMIFPRGDISNFPTPIKDETGLYNARIMDGSSLLPVLALNVQPGDEIADLHTGRGDKALAILLTLSPKSVFLNETSGSELKKLQKTLDDFIPEYFMKHVEIEIQQNDVRLLKPTKQFDKILLDVPCTRDRTSVNEEDGNFFSGQVAKKRNQLPHQLRDMLVSALDMLNVNGSVVYCTSTLSPVLNDGIVQEALYDYIEKKQSTFVVNDLKNCFKPLTSCFRLDFSFRYGILVLPFLPNNFGPMYISKITRVS